MAPGPSKAHRRDIGRRNDYKKGYQQPHHNQRRPDKFRSKGPERQAAPATPAAIQPGPVTPVPLQAAAVLMPPPPAPYGSTPVVAQGLPTGGSLQWVPDPPVAVVPSPTPPPVVVEPFAPLNGEKKASGKRHRKNRV